MDCPKAGIWIKWPDTVAGSTCAACHPPPTSLQQQIERWQRCRLSPPRTKSLSDPEFKKRLQALRQTDNYRNWFYLARTYGLLLLVIGGAIWFYQFTRASGLSLAWNVPVFAVAIILVGALQHHLANLAHEAVHHTLFKNRYLNDLASEWLCSFPMFSSTFHYGLHHLAHHQFVNDPVRDPDISQLQKSGHRLSFPILKQEFMEVLFRQMWVPNLVRYSLARAEYDSLGTEHNPYIREDWEFSKRPQRLTVAYLALQALFVRGAGLLWQRGPAGRPAARCLGGHHARARAVARALLLSKQDPAAVFDPLLGDDADHVHHRLVLCLGVGDLVHGRLVGGVLFPAVGAATGHVVSVVHGAAADRATW